MSPHRRADCRVCGREMAVKLDGTLIIHGARDIYATPCQGSGEPPAGVPLPGELVEPAPASRCRCGHRRLRHPRLGRCRVYGCGCDRWLQPAEADQPAAGSVMQR